MKAERFEYFLATHHTSKGSGKPLSKRAVSDCVSRVRRVERILGIDVDAVRLEVAGIRQLIARLEAVASEQKLSVFAIRDCKTALNRYAEFKVNSRSLNNRPVV